MNNEKYEKKINVDLRVIKNDTQTKTVKPEKPGEENWNISSLEIYSVNCKNYVQYF